MDKKPLVLASGSPRRRELLERAGVPLVIDPAHVDETLRSGETPPDYALRLAREKAATVAARHSPAWVLGADTVVVLDGEVLGKPDDAGQARAMLTRLAGRVHQVLTATCLLAPATLGREPKTQLVTTRVEFRQLAPKDIDGYVQSQEWRGKAGGYAIQGIAAALVLAIAGSYTNVVGLPLGEVLEDLEAGRADGAPAAELQRGQPA